MGTFSFSHFVKDIEKYNIVGGLLMHFVDVKDITELIFYTKDFLMIAVRGSKTNQLK